jgi:hypothetical protein
MDLRPLHDLNAVSIPIFDMLPDIGRTNLFRFGVLHIKEHIYFNILYNK